MSDFKIVFYALCLAFCWVEVLRLGRHKPFNCMKCMVGWLSLLIGVIATGWHGVFLWPVGLFAGAIFSAIKSRYL